MSNPGALLAQIREKADQLAQDPKRFTVYRDDPVGFARDILGIPLLHVGDGTPEDPDVVGLWPKQVEILEAIRDHHDVAIRAGHGVSKSHTLSVADLWWTYARQGICITTASSWDQVAAVLWQEIHAMRNRARVKLPGESNMTSIRIGDKWYTEGRSVANPTSFHGIHHPDLLILIDEAPGIEDPIHDAISSLTISRGNRRAMVGNPVEMGGAFQRAFAPDSGWHQIHMSCLDHPNVVHGREIIPGGVTVEWVRGKAKEYGEDSPLYAARVLGNFPEAGSDQVFPHLLTSRAMDPEAYAAALKEPGLEKEPVVLALDVARFGSNRTVLVTRRGGVVEEPKAWVGQDTNLTFHEVIQQWKATGAVAVIVDEVGLGGPLVDRLAAAGVPVFGYHSGKAARDGVYKNRRAELWMRVKREWFLPNKIRLPKHDQLKRDLEGARYRFDSSFKIMLDAKKDMDHSPDFADAVLMAFAADWEMEAAAQESRGRGYDENPLPGGGEMDLPAGLPSGF